MSSVGYSLELAELLAAHEHAVTGAAQRRQWADALRAPLFDHPQQLAFVSSKARLRATDKNRRAGGTEGQGRADLADMIENDGEYIEVYAETIGEYSKNWLCRRPGPSALELLQQVGMVEGRDYHVRFQARDCVRAIEFPWGSRLRVCSAGDLRMIRRHRGARPTKLRFDEAQNLVYILEILADVAMAASADYDAEISMVGTPGPEVETFFHSVVTGRIAGWEVHHFYSCDNPFFGSTWSERFERAVASRIRTFGPGLQATDEEIETLCALTQEEFHVLARAEMADLPPKLLTLVRRINPKIFRELFGRWMAEESQYIHAPFRSMEDDQLYWASWAEEIGSVARGEGTSEDFTRATERWPERISQLPTVRTHFGTRPKQWRAVIGGDFGFYPDPFALWVWIHSREHEAMLELDSCKANFMSETDQFAAVRHWIDALAGLGIPISGLVLDAGGAEGMPVVQGWLDKLRPIMPSGYRAVEAAQKANAWAQRFQLNAEIRQGRLKFLRNSPGSVEGRYLKRIPPDPEKGRLRAQVDKHRVVSIAGNRCTPGDHCLDAGRYAWFWSTHVWATQHDTDELDPAEEMRRNMRAQELR